MPEGTKPPEKADDIDQQILDKARNTSIEEGTNGLDVVLWDKPEGGNEIGRLRATKANKAKYYFELREILANKPAAAESPEVTETPAPQESRESPEKFQEEPANDEVNPLDRTRGEFMDRLNKLSLSKETRETMIRNMESVKEIAGADDVLKEAEPKLVTQPKAVAVESSAGRPTFTEKRSSSKAEPPPADNQTQSQGKDKLRQKETPAASLPPLEWTRSDRTENLAKSPFSPAPRTPEAVIPGPEPRPDLQEKQLTLTEILADPKQQELFAMFIGSFGGDRGVSTVQKYMESQADPSAMTDLDHRWMVHYQAEFHKRSLLLKEMRKDTKTEDLEFMLRNNPAFSFLHNKVTAERATELVKMHMDRVFMRMNNEQLTRVIEASRANYDIRRSDHYRELYELVQAKMASGKKAPDLFSIVDKTPSEREKIFAFLKPNFMQTFFSRNGLTADNSVSVLESMDENRKKIMEVMAATISNDVELKREVAIEVVTGTRVREIGEGLHTRDTAHVEAHEGIEKIEDTDALRRRIRHEGFRVKVAVRAGKSWEDMGPQEREEKSYEQLQEEKMLPERRRGFFGLWLGSIYDLLFPDMQDKLKNEFENPKKTI